MEHVADRLRLISVLAELPNDAMLVQTLNISHSRWSNYIAEKYPLPIEIAERIIALVPGLDLDWIYRGTEDGVSGRILQKLRKLRAVSKLREA